MVEQYLSDSETEINVRVQDDWTVQEQCPECGNWYSRIGSHWGQSSCSYPSISQEKMEMCKGLIMGDGSLGHRNAKNSRIQVANTNYEFLQYLKNVFRWLSGELSKIYTAKKSANRDCNRNFNSNVNMENYFDIYQLQLRSHPQFNKFREWYETGEIVFPKLEFTPELLRMWYVSDGTLEWNSNSFIRFTSRNESDRGENIIDSFRKIDFECSNGSNSKNFRLPTSQTEAFFDYIGHDPVPGFEYKWAWEDKQRYHELKNKCEREYKTQTFEIRD